MEIFDELIDQQKAKLFKLAREIVPHVTPDDLMQPNDFPVLEAHPLFRYEEGLLEGLYAARTAVFCASKSDGVSTVL